MIFSINLEVNLKNGDKKNNNMVVNLMLKIKVFLSSRIFLTLILDFWSMSPSDFSTTFKFGAFPGVAQDENAEDANKYLEMNRKLEV